MSKSIIPEIKTERLTLNSLQKTDFPYFKELQTNPKIRLYLGGPVTEDKIELKFDCYLSATPPEYHFAVRVDEKNFAGIISLGQHHEEPQLEISFQFLSQFWKRGYAFEASKAVLSYAQNTLGVPKIVAETQSINATSIRLLEKLGMKPEKKIIRFGENQTIFSTT